jgi:hypothetical protein
MAEELPKSLPEARIKSPPAEYWARGGRYPHRVRVGERMFQALEYLQGLVQQYGPDTWIRPSKLAKDLGLTQDYAKHILLKFKRESYVDTDREDIEKWHKLEVYRINDRGRWKLEELRKELR